MITMRLFAGAAGLAALAARSVRAADERRADAAWSQLAARGATPHPPPFDPATVQDLPGPARRWFHRSLAPGTPLHRLAEIEMEGELVLGTASRPRPLPMRAREILAPPHGFVWRPAMGSGAMRVTGSDGCAEGGAWTRFWLLGLIPVARAADTPDLLLSAWARGIAEAALWLPAALLPGEGVAWEAMDDARARVTVSQGRMRAAVEITVAEDGRLASLVMPRWSNANPEHRFRWQPFGGTVGGVRAFGGVTVADEVEAGNHFGTKDYFPFFRARVLDVRYR